MSEDRTDTREPMDCAAAREALSAALDGELGAAERARLDRHLRGCAGCAGYARQLPDLNAMLHTELSDDSDADALFARVRAALDAEDAARSSETAAAPANDRGAPVTRRRLLAGGGIAAALLLGVGGAGLYRARDAGATEVVAETVNDFLTFRASGRKLHVAGAAPDEVRRWLAERVNFDIPMGIAPPPGFELTGGRLCAFLNRRLVFLHYEMGPHGVSLYVMNEEGLELPTRQRRRAGTRQVAATSLKGVTNVAWRDEGLVFVVVSDLGEPEVLDFVARI